MWARKEKRMSRPPNACRSRGLAFQALCPGSTEQMAENVGFGVSTRQVHILALLHTSCVNPGGCVIGALEPALGASVSVTVKRG